MRSSTASAVSRLLTAFPPGAGGACVEVTGLRDEVAMRDSKHPSGPVLVITRAEWRAFLGGVQAGEFG